MKASDISDAEILGLIAEHSRDHSKPWAWEVLIGRGIPEKVVYAKYEKLDRRGWIEYGVSLRTGWLTDKGREALRALLSRPPSSDQPARSMPNASLSGGSPAEG